MLIRRGKLLLLGLVLAALCGLLLLNSGLLDRDRPLGLPLVQNAAPDLSGAPPADFALLFDGCALPRHAAEGIYFVPQNSAAGAWQGMLTCSEGFSLQSWAADSFWEDKPAALEQAHTFTLNVQSDRGALFSVQVCMTGMPLLTLHSEAPLAQLTDKGDAHPVTGALFDGVRPAQEFSGDFGVRGATSMYFPKKSYKLSLTGKTDSLELGSLLPDDDILLNAMFTDSTCIKEKLVTDRWNLLAEQGLEPYAMASMEYALVFLNDTCVGLYGVQNRLEAKTLGLNRLHDRLYKGNQWDIDAVSAQPEPLRDFSTLAGLPAQEAFLGFELKWPKTDTNDHTPWQPLIDYFDLFHTGSAEALAQSSLYVPENQMDYSLFCELFALFDNKSSRNVYYAARAGASGSTVYRIPWDTDRCLDFDQLSYAFVFYTRDDFAAGDIYKTVEMTRLLADLPEMQEAYATRWSMLREVILDPEQCMEHARALATELIANGGYEVEDHLWPTHYTTADLTAVQECLFTRSALLDAELLALTAG